MNWLPGSVGAGEQAEFETLQTDVMRFTAIIALCLVAVFALMQSLPQSAAAPEPGDADTRLAQLEIELAAARQALAASEQQATDLRARLREQRQTAQRRPSPAVTAAVEPTEPTEPVATPPVPRAPVGFSLRFASAATLQRLNATGAIGLYARTDAGIWRFDQRGGRVRAVRVGSPGQFYEMAAATVPALYRRALPRTADDTTTVWGVTLPGATIEAIRQLMRKHSGGAMVIESDGRVVLR